MLAPRASLVMVSIKPRAVCWASQRHERLIFDNRRFTGLFLCSMRPAHGWIYSGYQCYKLNSRRETMDMEQDFVGTKRWIRPASPYEIYMEEQNLPIHRGTVGFYDIRDLTLGPWKRMGARGAFIELNGCGGLQGIYVIEVPGAGAITAEKHMYEEIFYVLEGRGTTEIWSGDDANKKQTFEWQPGSLFSPPMNTWHRIVNATSSPALLLGVTNAPPIFSMYRSQDALFNNPYEFKDRYDGSANYFKAHTELGKDPRHGRARNFGNIIPDADRVELPLDGQRGVGHRTFFWSLSGNSYQGFIAQYAPGRYSRCHAHEAGPVLLCLGGKGYTITWPGEAGRRPGRTEGRIGPATRLQTRRHRERGPWRCRLVPRPLWRIQGTFARAGLPRRLSQASQRCTWKRLVGFESRHQRRRPHHRVPRRGPAYPQDVPRAIGERRRRLQYA